MSRLTQPNRSLNRNHAAILQCNQVLRQKNQAVIVSIYPIATANIIGYPLPHWTKCHLVVDLSRPKLKGKFLAGLTKLKIFAQIEPKTANHASAKFLTTPEALLLLQAANYNVQTQVKTYEFIRSCKPVLMRPLAKSDSWQLMKHSSFAVRVHLDDASTTNRAFQKLLSQTTFNTLSAEAIVPFSCDKNAIALNKNHKRDDK